MASCIIGSSGSRVSFGCIWESFVMPQVEDFPRCTAGMADPFRVLFTIVVGHRAVNGVRQE